MNITATPPVALPVRGQQHADARFSWVSDEPSLGPDIYRGYLPTDPRITLAIITRDEPEGYSLSSAFLADDRDGECHRTLLAAMDAAERAASRWVTMHTTGWLPQGTPSQSSGDSY